MPDSGNGQVRPPWRGQLRLEAFRLAGVQLASVAMLALGTAGSLIARERNKDRDGQKNSTNDRDRKHNDSDRNHSQDRRDERRRNNDEADDDRETRAERRARKDGDDRHDKRAESQQSDANSEKKNNNNNGNNNNNNSNGNNNNNNSSNNDADDDTDDDSGGNGKGNAGSGFFDSSLATKAKRRANDFDTDKDDRDDGVSIDEDNGESTFQTGNISFTTGPDGIEVVTGNINYTAAPTPTPTPFPTLELPERDRLDVFANLPGAQQTPVPDSGDGVPSDVPSQDTSAPPPTTSQPAPPVSDGADTSGNTDGGDNSSAFLS